VQCNTVALAACSGAGGGIGACGLDDAPNNYMPLRMLSCASSSASLSTYASVTLVPLGMHLAFCGIGNGTPFRMHSAFCGIGNGTPFLEHESERSGTPFLEHGTRSGTSFQPRSSGRGLTDARACAIIARQLGELS
jgi:hypothetical protein